MPKYNILFSMIDVFNSEKETELLLKEQTILSEIVPESRKVGDRVLYHIMANNIQEIEDYKEILITIDDPRIIGIWENDTGLQQGYEYENQGTVEEPNLVIIRNGEDIYYPFDITEYTKYLADINEYDEEGLIISSRRPTEEEARDIQVNTLAGLKIRNLQNLS